MLLVMIIFLGAAMAAPAEQCNALISSAGKIQIECNLDEAAETYRKALDVCGSTAFIYSRLGTTYYLMGKTTKARNSYHTAIHLRKKQGRTKSVDMLRREMQAIESHPAALRYCKRNRSD